MRLVHIALVSCACLYICLFFLQTSTATERFCSWKQFNDDYKDTDGDSEQDDYESFDIGGPFITIFDTLTDFETYPDLYVTELTLQSDPDNKAYFGNTLDSSVQKGKEIRMKVSIISSNESDDDPCEYYNIDSIWVYVAEDDDTDDTTDTPTDMDWKGGVITCSICGGFWVIVIVLVVVYYRRKKKRTDAAKSGAADPYGQRPQGNGYDDRGQRSYGSTGSQDPYYSRSDYDDVRSRDFHSKRRQTDYNDTYSRSSRTDYDDTSRSRDSYSRGRRTDYDDSRSRDSYSRSRQSGYDDSRPRDQYSRGQRTDYDDSRSRDQYSRGSRPGYDTSRSRGSYDNGAQRGHATGSPARAPKRDTMNWDDDFDSF